MYLHHIYEIYKNHKKLFESIDDTEAIDGTQASMKNSINTEEDQMEPDPMSLNQKCMNRLKKIYKNNFIGSELSKMLIEELNNSVIEFRFL